MVNRGPRFDPSISSATLRAIFGPEVGPEFAVELVGALADGIIPSATDDVLVDGSDAQGRSIDEVLAGVFGVTAAELCVSGIKLAIPTAE